MVTISKKGKENFGIPKLHFAIVSNNDLEERAGRLWPYSYNSNMRMRKPRLIV